MAFVQITWTDSVTVGVTGYNIYRDDVLLTAIGIGIQSHVDDTALYVTTYKYTVQAIDPFGESIIEDLGVNYQNITLGAAPTLYEFNGSFTDRTWVDISGADSSAMQEGDILEITLSLDEVASKQPLLSAVEVTNSTYLMLNGASTLELNNALDGSDTFQSHTINSLTSGIDYILTVEYGAGTLVTITINGTVIVTGTAYVTRNYDQILVRDRTTSLTNQFVNGKLKSIKQKGHYTEFRSTSNIHNSLTGNLTYTFGSEAGTTVSTLFTVI